MSQALLPLLPRLLADLCMFLVGVGPSTGAPGAGGAFPLAPQATTVQWLRLDPRQPRTLYDGLSDADYYDHGWRSTDAGATWSSLDAALVAALGGDTCSHPAPVVFSSDGKTVYQLPTRIGRIDAVLAGSRSGDPIYLLVAGG